MTSTDLTAVSLFAGIGGFDLALTRAGVRVVAAVEIDPAARSVLRRQFPDVTLFEDVREVTGAHLRAAGFVPGRGVITAGWPCQGNSVAGRRGGLADPRSGLWTHVRRLLADTGAAWFIGENVPGLLSVNRGEDFGVVLDDLAGLGMGFCWRVLDAQHFGVPQRRRRVFVVGRAGGDPRGPAEVLLEPEGREGNPAPRSETRPNIAGTLGSRVGGSRTTDLDGHGAYIVGSLTTSSPGGIGGVDDNVAQAGHLVAAALTAREGKGPDSDATTTLLPLDGVAVRKLTPLECERLQQLDGWITGQADAARYRQCGNAVAVPVVEWVSRRLVAVDARSAAAAEGVAA